MARAGRRNDGRLSARTKSGGPRRLDQLTAFLERWAPPGGWIVAALLLFTLSTVAGVVFPVSPAGLLLQSLVGVAGAPLVPAWGARRLARQRARITLRSRRSSSRKRGIVAPRLSSSGSAV